MKFKLKNTDNSFINNPNEEQISNEIASIDGKNYQFVILEKTENDYIQTCGDANVGLYLEYQEGNIKNHFRAEKDILPLRKVINAFQKYSNSDDSWKKDFNWSKVVFESTSKKWIFFVFLRLLILSIWAFLIYNFKIKQLVFLGCSVLFLYNILLNIFFSNKDIIKKRKDVILNGLRPIYIRRSFVSIFLGITLIRSFWFVQFKYFWLLLGMFTLLLGIIVLISSFSVSKVTPTLSFNKITKKGLRNEIKKKYISIIIFIALLLFWIFSWYV